MKSLTANFVLALILFVVLVAHRLSEQRDQIDGMAAANGVTAPMAQDTASAPAATAAAPASSGPQIDSAPAPAAGS